MTLNQHPSAKAALERSAQKAAEHRKQEQTEVDLTNEFGLSYVHIRDVTRTSLGNLIKPHGGATLAYQFAGRDRVNVSVATCHKIDLYSKAIGRLTSASNFKEGRYVTLRIPKGISPVTFLKLTFELSAMQSLVG